MMKPLTAFSLLLTRHKRQANTLNFAPCKKRFGSASYISTWDSLSSSAAAAEGTVIEEAVVADLNEISTIFAFPDVMVLSSTVDSSTEAMSLLLLRLPLRLPL
jgi:hypothetical protein